MNRINLPQAIHLYTVEHKTLAEIGTHFGVSRVAVWKRLRKAGIGREEGTWVAIKCSFCGNPFRQRRSRWRKSLEHYCTSECYFAGLENNSTYIAWRHGSRLARALASQHFELEPEHIVHHQDGNQRNNDLSNLRVFACQADHIKWHRGQTSKPIWDGSSHSTRTCSRCGKIDTPMMETSQTV